MTTPSKETQTKIKIIQDLAKNNPDKAREYAKDNDLIF